MRLPKATTEDELQTKVDELALTDPQQEVREEAIRHITDQKLLEQVALNDKVSILERSTAIGKITDIPTLWRIHDTVYELHQWNLAWIAGERIADLDNARGR